MWGSTIFRPLIKNKIDIQQISAGHVGVAKPFQTLRQGLNKAIAWLFERHIPVASWLRAKADCTRESADLEKCLCVSTCLYNHP